MQTMMCWCSSDFLNIDDSVGIIRIVIFDIVHGMYIGMEGITDLGHLVTLKICS